MATLGLPQHRKPAAHTDNDATMRQIDLNAVGGDGMIDLSAIGGSGGDEIELPSAGSFVSEYDEEQSQPGGRTIRASYGAFQPMAHVDTNLMNRNKTPTSHRHKSSYASSRNMSIDSGSSSPSDFSPKVDEQSGSANSSSNGKNKNVFEGSFAFRARGNSSANTTSSSPQSSSQKSKLTGLSPQMREESLGSLSPSFQFPPVPNPMPPPSSPSLSRSASLVRSHSHNPSSSTGTMWELDDVSANVNPDVPLAAGTNLKRRPTVVRNSSVSVMETIPSPDLKPSDGTSKLSQSTPSSLQQHHLGSAGSAGNGHRRRSSQASESMNPSSARYRNIGRRASRSEGQVVVSLLSDESVLLTIYSSSVRPCRQTWLLCRRMQPTTRYVAVAGIQKI